MSVKSQKSYYNDELSEVLDKSYSLTRNGSEESVSGSDEDEILAKELMNVMTPAFLSKLRRCFKKTSASKEKAARDIDSKVEQIMQSAAASEGIEFTTTLAPPDPLSLDESAFVTAINNIFGHHKYSTHASKLFRVLDPYNAGRAKWRQLVAKLEAVGAKKTGSKKDRWNRINCGDIKKLPHCNRETIVKIVNIEREDAFCYIVVSRGGRIGIYSGYLKLMHSYELFYHRTGLHRRVKNCWITDALYLTDVQYIMYSASDRSLTFYDATTLSHTPVYCITGMPNIPTSLAYAPSLHSADGSDLAVGTERGHVIRIRFHSPRIQFLHTKAPDSINYYFWMEMSSPPHTSLLTITTWRRVHSRSVRRISFARSGEILLSCSHDSNASVRVRHVPGKLDDYVFKVQRGVSCFHAVYPLHLLATGSIDGAVRLWETSQTAPFAVLTAPSAAPVLDIAIIPAREAVVAYCNNCVRDETVNFVSAPFNIKTVHIWDIYEECLLQSVKIKFPFLGVLGKKVDFGAYCIHPGPIYKVEDDQMEPQPSTSRRPSSVVQASTGGLIIQPESTLWQNVSTQQPEYVRFNRSTLLVSCCSYICILSLSESKGRICSPPGDTRAPRRPSAWDLPELLPAGKNPKPQRPTRAASPKLLMPSAAEHTSHDLDTLLENAGLKGILEKDFVLMQGLKHDLNKKLADMEANKEAMRSCVNMGAPYLSLRTYPPIPMEPVDEMMEKYKRVMKLFPGSSMTGTPTNSEISTPRHRNNK